MQIAKDRLGSEAVVISTRPVKLGGLFGLPIMRRSALWITAGILVEEPEDRKRESHDRIKAFQTFLDYQHAARSHNSGVRDDLTPPSAFAPNPAATPTSSATAAYAANSRPAREDAQPNALTREVDELKETLSKVLQRLDGENAPAEKKEDEAKVEAPRELDEISTRLVDADVDREIAISISQEYAENGRGRKFEDWLSMKIPVMGTDTTSALGGRRVLFAGSTGVGKTTTIAKIASAQSLWEDRKVVLMTADTYRIAAVEQLRTYAKILGIPIEIVPEPKDVQAAMKKHRDADLILLDTAGRSHYDGTRIKELNDLYDAFEPDSTHLVVASNVKYRDMLNIIERMGVVPLSSLLFTKLDETSSYGIMLNVIKDFALPVSFFTTGQNVPNDIEVASGGRFVDLLLGVEGLKRD